MTPSRPEFLAPAVAVFCLFSASCGAETAPCGPDSVPCVEPTWASIHETVVADSCAVEFCHGDPDGNNEADLDLRGVDASYALLFDISTSEDCGSLALPLVEPNDPSRSLFYEKLFAVGPGEDDALCGFRMPYAGAPLPAQWTDAIRTWIEDGAPGP